MHVESIRDRGTVPSSRFETLFRKGRSSSGRVRLGAIALIAGLLLSACHSTPMPSGSTVVPAVAAQSPGATPSAAEVNDHGPQSTAPGPHGHDPHGHDPHAHHRHGDDGSEKNSDAAVQHYVSTDHLDPSEWLEVPDYTLHVPTVSCKLRNFKHPKPEELEGGAWEGVIPAEGSAAVNNILGMQTVHAVLLPSGKLLLVSGSSWRNLNGIQYYPLYKNPDTPPGLFVRKKDPFRVENLDWYYGLVNNAALYDPDDNTFFRIPVPVPEPDRHSPGRFAPNDFFCTGHQHLPDGNVLFSGGTQYYSPYRTGHNSSYIFDWRNELNFDWPKIDWRQRPVSNVDTPWTFSGFMKRGRWYPSLVPLLDGRLAIFSGFVGFDEGFPPMYVFEINSWIEIFDPDAFDSSKPQQAWKAADAGQVPDGPFTTLINPDFEPTPNVDCGPRCRESNKYDAFKLYPQNYLQPDGRIYMTREGDWVSLRTCDAAFMRKTNKTYFVSLEDDGDELKIDFDRGPDRPELITSYGTTFRDLESGEIRLIGGQPTSPGTLYPLNAKRPTHFAGGLGSTRLETFTPSTGGVGGSWNLDSNFLGDQFNDNRTMHYTVALPTGQYLIINGGNYDFYGPTFTPILLTPNCDEGTGVCAGYSKKPMFEALEPRLYHNTAVLLPDGRVFVSGGNSARATVTPRTEPYPDWEGPGQPPPDLEQVEVDVYFFDDGPMGKGLPGQLTTPTENWTAEIFSPPYLFIDGDRRAKITSLEPTEPVDYQPTATIGGKRYDLFHSGVDYRMGLSDLPSCPVEKGKLVLIKLPSVTHGWQTGQELVDLDFEAAPGGIRFTTPDARAGLIPPAFYMLFYTDCRGKPSKSWMVRFDNQAMAP